jgi:hypothetical protein
MKAFAIVAGFFVSVSLSALARAEDPAEDRGGDGGGFFQPERAATARTYVDVRGGVSTTNEAGMPEVCFEGSPLKFLTLESCGTGAGLWRDDQGRQMMHIRAELQPFRFVLGGVALDPQLGLGFAEMQIGEDEPGFRFDSANGKMDTSGPELTLSLNAKVPMQLNLELVAELTSGLAYFPNAGELASPQEQLQPFTSLSIGLGF